MDYDKPLSSRVILSIIRLMRKELPYWKYDIHRFPHIVHGKTITRITVIPTSHCLTMWERSLKTESGAAREFFIEFDDTTSTTIMDLRKTVISLINMLKNRTLIEAEKSDHSSHVKELPIRPLSRRQLKNIVESVNEFNHLVSLDKADKGFTLNIRFSHLEDTLRKSATVLY